MMRETSKSCEIFALVVWGVFVSQRPAFAGVDLDCKMNAPSSKEAGEIIKVEFECENGGDDGKGLLALTCSILELKDMQYFYDGSWSGSSYDCAYPGNKVEDYCVYEKGDSICCKGACGCSAKHLMVEGIEVGTFDGKDGGSSGNEKIKVKINAPPNLKELTFLCRAAFCDYNWQNCVRWPSSGTEDQQGYLAKKKIVKVNGGTASTSSGSGDTDSSSGNTYMYHANTGCVGTARVWVDSNGAPNDVIEDCGGFKESSAPSFFCSGNAVMKSWTETMGICFLQGGGAVCGKGQPISKTEMAQTCTAYEGPWWPPVCEGEKVVQGHEVWYGVCDDGFCISEFETKETSCSYSCSSGACVPNPKAYKACKGNEVWWASESGAYTEKVATCKGSKTGKPTHSCKGDDIIESVQTSSSVCEKGACTWKVTATTTSTVETCGGMVNETPQGAATCKGSGLVQPLAITQKVCLAGACTTETVTSEKVETCAYGCMNGTCLGPCTLTAPEWSTKSAVDGDPVTASFTITGECGAKGAELSIYREDGEVFGGQESELQSTLPGISLTYTMDTVALYTAGKDGSVKDEVEYHFTVSGPWGMTAVSDVLSVKPKSIKFLIGEALSASAPQPGELACPSWGFGDEVSHTCVAQFEAIGLKPLEISEMALDGLDSANAATMLGGCYACWTKIKGNAVIAGVGFAAVIISLIDGPLPAGEVVGASMMVVATGSDACSLCGEGIFDQVTTKALGKIGSVLNKLEIDEAIKKIVSKAKAAGAAVESKWTLVTSKGGRVVYWTKTGADSPLPEVEVIVGNRKNPQKPHKSYRFRAYPLLEGGDELLDFAGQVAIDWDGIEKLKPEELKFFVKLFNGNEFPELFVQLTKVPDSVADGAVAIVGPAKFQPWDFLTPPDKGVGVPGYWDWAKKELRIRVVANADDFAARYAALYRALPHTLSHAFIEQAIAKQTEVLPYVFKQYDPAAMTPKGKMFVELLSDMRVLIPEGQTAASKSIAAATAEALKGTAISQLTEPEEAVYLAALAQELGKPPYGYTGLADNLVEGVPTLFKDAKELQAAGAAMWADATYVLSHIFSDTVPPQEYFGVLEWWGVILKKGGLKMTAPPEPPDFATPEDEYVPAESREEISEEGYPNATELVETASEGGEPAVLIQSPSLFGSPKVFRSGCKVKVLTFATHPCKSEFSHEVAERGWRTELQSDNLYMCVVEFTAYVSGEVWLYGQTESGLVAFATIPFDVPDHCLEDCEVGCLFSECEENSPVRKNSVNPLALFGVLATLWLASRRASGRRENRSG